MNNLKSMSLNFNHVAKIVFISCLSIEAFLLLANILFNYLDILDELYIRRIWNIARELSIPTWFSSTQTQLMGATALLIGLLQKNDRIKGGTKVTYISWIVSGCFFIWIGIDDAAEIHEKLGTALTNLNNSGADSSIEHVSFSWHTYIAPIFVLFGLYLTYFFWSELTPYNLFRYVFVGFGCWVTSQMIDFTEGLESIDETYTAIQIYLGSESTYLVPHSFKVIEEMLEMIGTTFLWVGFLHFLAVQLKGKRIEFGSTD